MESAIEDIGVARSKRDKCGAGCAQDEQWLRIAARDRIDKSLRRWRIKSAAIAWQLRRL